MKYVEAPWLWRLLGNCNVYTTATVTSFQTKYVFIKTKRINYFKSQWNNPWDPRSLNNVNVDIFTCLGQWSRIVTPQREGGRYSWNFLVPDIYGISFTVSRGRKLRMQGGVLEMPSRNIFEFWDCETVFSGFWRHFWAKSKGLNSHF